jgi:chromate transporter
VISLEIFYLCFRTSLISFAGVYGALPELTRVFVVERGWLTFEQLAESYVIGQVLPGPNMVLAPLLGYRIAGLSGASAAFAGIYMPPLLVTAVVARAYVRFRHVTHVRRIELGLRPLVMGLMIGAGAGVLREQVANQGVLATTVVAAAALLVLARRWLAPATVLLAAGALFWLVAQASAFATSALRP